MQQPPPRGRGRRAGRGIALAIVAALAAACSPSAPRSAPPSRPLASRTASTALPDVVPDQQPAPQGSAALCSGSQYGADVLRTPIAQALAHGSVAEAVAAMDAGKKARGAAVGCPAIDPDSPSLAWKRGGSTTAPSVAAVRGVWRAQFARLVSRFAGTGPLPTLQTWGVVALGGYQALEAGESADRGRLRAIVDLALGNQYSPATSSTARSPQPTPGVWGVPDDPSCDTLAALCVTYDSGPLTGRRVAVADTSPPAYLRGNLATEHAVFGALLVEAARVTGDSRLRSAARLAGSWSAQEPAVLGASYVARNVTLLALLYGATGDDGYRRAMLDKLDRSLLPGLLMDADRDGRVDGPSGRAFSSLAAVAQVPGRMWDGRASRPENQGVVASALTEAYAALRDRGRTEDAARVRPYAVAALDNVSHEVLDVGVPTHGVTPLPVALATGLWKLARAERQSHPRWASAMALLWNTGRGLTAPATITYLRYLDGDRYVPASAR